MKIVRNRSRHRRAVSQEAQHFTLHLNSGIPTSLVKNTSVDIDCETVTRRDLYLIGRGFEGEVVRDDSVV